MEARLAPSAEGSAVPTVEGKRRLGRARNPVDWGWAPYLVLTAASGLGLVAVADALSRRGSEGGQPLFWAGVLLIVLPLAARLASAGATRRERILLVVLLGLSLYLVKVFLDPFAFTFADELVHAYNADEIRRTGSFFSPNPILIATPRYPGLETATAALGSVAGIGTFGAGLVVVGAARLIIVLALFLFLEGVSRSARIAGIGVVVYAATPNFLFFDAQFSYESLALPLALVAMLALLRWERADTVGESVAWLTVLFAAIIAVVVTHHITSYVLAGLLVFVAIFRSFQPDEGSNHLRWLVASFAVAACVYWLVLVANETVGYLWPVFERGLSQIAKTLSGESATRRLFSSTSYHAPLWERLVGISSVGLTALGLPLGLAVVWRSYRRDPYACIAAAAAVAYVGVILVRLVPAAWEIANRSSEFFGIGLSLILGFTMIRLWQAPGRTRVVRSALIAAVGVILVGNIVAGWPPPLRVAQPYRIEAGGNAIDPQGVVAAEWSRSVLGVANRIAADPSNARLQLDVGRQTALTGTNPDINDALQAETLAPWVVRRLHLSRVRYVLIDRRRISFDPMRGLFFRPTHQPAAALFPAATSRRFDAGGADRVFDSGNIVVYDVGRLDGTTPAG